MLPREGKYVSLNIFIWMRTEEKLKITWDIFSLNMERNGRNGRKSNLLKYVFWVFKCARQWCLVFIWMLLFCYSINYKANSRTSRDTQRKHVLKKNKNNNSNNWQTFFCKRAEIDLFVTPVCINTDKLKSV